MELASETVITDGQWHHIGLARDGTRRYLYADGVQVAKDPTNVFGITCNGDMHMGTGKTLDAGSFFSGLIDDVRIYNQTQSAEEIEALAR